MKYILILFCLLFSIESMAQDKIILNSGDTLHVIISERNEERVSYSGYNDPEFNTTSISTDQIKKIQLHNGKIIDFKKSKYPRYYVGLYFGNAMPASDFANTDPQNNRSGFASDKPFLTLEGRMPIFRFIGLDGNISVGGFGVNDGTYFAYLNQEYNSTLNVYVNGKLSDYRYGTFSIGPDIGFNLGKRLKFFLPVQLSVINIATKGSDYINYVEQSSGASRVVSRTSNGNGVGVSVGIKLDFVIAKHVGIGLAAKFNGYNVNMKVHESYSTQSTNIDYQWRQNVTYLYVGINLHYHFK